MTTRIFSLKRVLLFLLVAIVTALIVLRLMLPDIVKDYVNKTLNNMNGYNGSVSGITIHLWRGAYQVHDMKINKENGKIPVPFVDIKLIDLSVEWRALLNGRVVAVINFQDPIINFAISPDGRTEQTGEEANWARALEKLAPIDINLITVNNGKVTYKDFSSDSKVDIAIKEIKGQARNLRNVENKGEALPSSFNLTGKSIGNGALTAEGNINILTDPSDFNLDAKLENVQLKSLNDYTRAYAAVDFSRGNLNVYTELAVKDGRVSGYVKPLAKDISFMDLSKHDKGPINIAWQTFVATIATIFKNQPKDQLATKIPFEGDISNPKAKIWPTLGGILKNAFIKAFSNNLDNTINFQDSGGK